MHRRSFNKLLAVGVATAAIAPAKLALAQLLNINPQVALGILNGIRAQQRRAPLVVDQTLMGLAQQQAIGMASRESLSHSVVGAFGARMGSRYGTAAENIALGTASLDAVFAQWVASPPHYANILNQQVTGMGIAVAVSATARNYWALILARPR